MTAPIGKPSIHNKYYLVGGGAAVLIVAYGMHKRKLAAQAAAAQSVTADPNAVDPNLAGLGGGYSPALGGASGVSPSLFGYQDPTTGQFIGGGGTHTIIAPSTNAQWAQQSEGYLAQLGYNPVSVSVAIGKYLLGSALTPDQLGIVQAAIGAEGQPPQIVPAPHLVPPSGQGGGPVGPANGYYRQIPSGTVWQVNNGMVYGITYKTWMAFGKNKPTTKIILANDPVLKLHYGGNI